MTIITLGIVDSAGTVIAARNYLPISATKVNSLFDVFARTPGVLETRDAHVASAPPAAQTAGGGASTQPAAAVVAAGDMVIDDILCLFRPILGYKLVCFCRPMSNLADIERVLTVVLDYLASKYAAAFALGGMLDAALYDILFVFDEAIQFGVSDCPFTAAVLGERMAMASENEQRYLEEKRRKEEEAERVKRAREAELGGPAPRDTVASVVKTGLSGLKGLLGFRTSAADPKRYVGNGISEDDLRRMRERSGRPPPSGGQSSDSGDDDSGTHTRHYPSDKGSRASPRQTPLPAPHEDAGRDAGRAPDAGPGRELREDPVIVPHQRGMTLRKVVKRR